MTEPVVIDCDYLFPKYAASFLLVEKNRAAFIENNTTHTVPHLLAALARTGLTPEQVEFVVITHVHLDHAGGSSALMAACPNATLLAHPRAAKHVIAPGKLIASARLVYGEEVFRRLYGHIEAVPAQRVREMGDGEVLKWGSREWHFIYTRGHANHHFCVWDSSLKGVFTGDSFGIQYPALQSGGRFLFASTSPTDFDANEARASIEKISRMDGDRAFLTHYGEATDLASGARDLLNWIDFSEELVERARVSSCEDKDLTTFCLNEINLRFHRELVKRGLDQPAAWELLQSDRELNAAGLAHVAKKQRGGYSK